MVKSARDKKEEFGRQSDIKAFTRLKRDKLKGKSLAFQMLEDTLDQVPSLEGTESYFFKTAEAMEEMLHYFKVPDDKPVYDLIKTLTQMEKTKPHEQVNE